MNSTHFREPPTYASSCAAGAEEGAAAPKGEAAPGPAAEGGMPGRNERVAPHSDDVATVRAAAQELREGEPESASSRLDRAIK
jgi:hypothetical protein